MPFLLESTRPARIKSSKSPNRKTEKIKTPCKNYADLILVVGKESIDFTRMIITYIIEKEFREKYSIYKKKK